MTDTLEKMNGYYCIYCDIKTDNKYNYDRHLFTEKHKRHQKYLQKTVTSTDNTLSGKYYECCCGKSYNHRQSLFSHKKKCLYIQEKNSNIEKNEKESNEKENNIMVKELIKQNQSILLENQEFKKLIMELVSKPSSISNVTNNNSTVNTNSHNKQFNLHFFLNETCKNAMNMTDFMDSLEIKNSELEDMGRLGYVKGISNIFIRALNELDEKERPLHCTDIKRETLYIKENNIWEKETPDNLKVKKIVTYIANKNFRKIPQWRKENPQSDDIMSKKHMEYMNMLNQVMTGITPEDESGINKIIKKIAMEVCIEK